MSGSRIVDERQLFAAGFVLEARNVVEGQSLWSREGEGHRSFTDDEALAWIAERQAEAEEVDR